MDSSVIYIIHFLEYLLPLEGLSLLKDFLTMSHTHQAYLAFYTKKIISSTYHKKSYTPSCHQRKIINPNQLCLGFNHFQTYPFEILLNE